MLEVRRTDAFMDWITALRDVSAKARIAPRNNGVGLIVSLLETDAMLSLLVMVCC